MSFISFGCFDFDDKRMIQNLKRGTRPYLKTFYVSLGLLSISRLLALFSFPIHVCFKSPKMEYGQIWGIWIVFWVFCVFYVFLSSDFIDIKDSKFRRRRNI